MSTPRLFVMYAAMCLRRLMTRTGLIPTFLKYIIMNIRFTFIAVCSCLCGAASAQTGTQQFRDFTESARLVQKLKPVQEMSCVRPG